MNHKKYKLFSKYVSFSMISTLGVSCYILADTYFIANAVGPEGLTALNLILPIFNVIFGFGILIGMGGATRFSIHFSQGNKEEASHYFEESITLALLVSIPLIFIGFFFPNTITGLLGADQSIKPIASQYLKTIVLFTPFFILNQILLTFIRNDHNPKLASIASLIGTLINIVFDYIFMYPLGLGMFGAALATGISPMISLLICRMHFKDHQSHFTFKKLTLSIRRVYRIIMIGFPTFLTEISAGFIIFAFNMIILSLSGSIGVASYGIICNLAIVVLALYNGLSQGIQPLLSHSYGAKQFEDIKLYLKYSIYVSLIISLIIYLFSVIFKIEIIALFNSENIALMETLASEGIVIYFLGFFFAGINIIMISYLAAVNHPKESALISFLRSGIIIIPLVIGLSSLFGLKGVWMAYPISEVIILMITILLTKKAISF